MEEDDLVPWEQYRPPAMRAPPDDLVPYEQYQPRQQTSSQASPPNDLVPYQQYQARQPEYEEPEPEGKLATAAREAAHGALPAAGGMLAGAASGAALGTALGPWGTIGGGLLGGLAGGFATSAVQEEALKAVGFDDSHQRAVNAKENPWSAAGGQLAAAAAGGSPGALARGAVTGSPAIGGRVADFMARNPRTTSAGIGGAAEVGMQAYQGEFHPEQLAGAVVGGGIFAKNYGWGDRASRFGEEVGTAWRNRPANTIPHGSPGPESNSGAAEEPLQVPRNSDIGDPQNQPVRSETAYSKPRDSARGETDGSRVLQPGDIDPTLAHALDAEQRSFMPTPDEEAAARGRGRREAETEPTLYGEALEREFPTIARPGEEPVPFTRQQRGPLEQQMGPPVAEPPQGRPTGEEPTLAPEGTPTPKDFWSYKPATETPTVEQVPEGAIAPGTTQAEFEQLSPGMRREIGRQPAPKPADDLELPDFLDRRPKPPAVTPAEMRSNFETSMARAAEAMGSEPLPENAVRLAPSRKLPPGADIQGFKEARAQDPELTLSKFIENKRAEARGGEPADVVPLRAAEPTSKDTVAAAKASGEPVGTALKKARAAEESGGWREGGPLYPHADLSRPKLEKLIKEADAESSRITKAFIDAGRGNERPTDIRDKTDQLSMDYKAVAEWQRSLREEAKRRMKGHGKMTPLDKSYRHSFYGGDTLRPDVLERGRSGRPLHSAPLPIGTEGQILEAGYAKATGPKLEPREPEMLAARRKGPEDPDAAIDAAAARATQAPGGGLHPTGGAPPIPPNAGAAAAQGAGGGTPPPGGPPPPPAGPAQPNMGHTPPQQQGFLKQLWGNIQSMAAAHLKGPTGMEARHLIRSSYGSTQRIAEQTADLLKKHEETIRAMPDADRDALINHIQGGTHFPNFVPTPEQRAFAADFKRGMQEWEAQLHQLDATDQMAFRKDFMAHMYQNPQAASGVFGGFGKRGSSGSTKQRTYDTYEDAKADGLTPFTNDPIEIGIRYANSIKDFVASRQVLQRGLDNGHIGYFRHEKTVGASGSPEPLTSGGPPPGWKKLDTPQKNGKDAYAPEDFADTFNNFYDKGFRSNDQRANVYDTLRNSTNAWTQLELGINAYHLFTMANEAMQLDLTKGFNKILVGDYRNGFKQILKSPVAFETMRREGKKFQSEYLDPNSTNPIAAIMAEANARPIGRGHAADYKFQDRGSFINKFSANTIQSELRQAWKEVGEDWAKAAGGPMSEKVLFPLRQAGRVLQTTAAPIFDKYIPMLKAGAVHSQMKDWHEAMVVKNPHFDMVNNPFHRREAVDTAMKIVDSVDNRFGEAIHDNAFMNARIKQAAMVGMRSYSWTIGAIKEIGGGSLAAGKALTQLARTGGADNRFLMTHPEWDPRMAYPLALAFQVSLVSSIYQFLRTGEAPEDWRDLYAPKTGGTVPGVGGRGMVKEHVLMPGYQKDVLGWLHHPVQEAYNKMGGLPTTVIEQVTGKDWRGQQIVRPGADPIEAFGQRAAHLYSKLSPISVKNMTAGSEPTSALTKVEKAIGFRAPGAYIQDPKGLEKAMKYREEQEWKRKVRRERKIENRQNP